MKNNVMCTGRMIGNNEDAPASGNPSAALGSSAHGAQCGSLGHMGSLRRMQPELWQRSDRKNQTLTDGGHNCVGPDRSYRTCNIQDCPEGSKDFREEQCAQFDGTDFQGKLYKWLPYYGAENPCELNCMPRGENFFYRHRSSVVDGTPCHPGRRDVCVEGVCKRLGCDNLLESTQQEDPCLQCGGSGQSCYQVKNSFSVRDLPTAIKNLRGEYYLNGHWVIEFSRATRIAGTMLYYQRGAEGDNVPETIIGRGPTTEPLVVELISQEPNQGVEYEFYLPNGRSREGYYWSFGSWSSCSRECGSGYQSRLVFCTIDNEAYPDYLCASLPRPQTNRTCNSHACPQIRSWKTGEWNTCSVTCGGGSQVRSVQCVSHDAAGPRVVEDAICAANAEAPPSLQTCNMQKCAEYQVTRWSACSVTCGSGEQTREVTCVGSAGMRLEETSCSALLRPTAVRPCEMAACLRQISWHVGDWGLCSKSCGSGSRERQVICSDRERNLYPVSQCNVHPKPSTMERCNTQSCYSPQPRRPETDPTRTNTVQDPHGSAPALHCSQSYYGCCPDGRTSAGGPQGLGCPHVPAPPPAQPHCAHTSYGCCQDRLTAAQGPNKEGCAEYAAPAPTAASSLPTENAAQCRLTTYGCCYDRTTPAGGPNGEGCPSPPNHIEHSICSLPRAAGSCSTWTPRYHYDVITSKCLHFWFGGCHGNSNNFMTRADCQRACQSPSPSQQGPGPLAPAGEPTPRRESTPGSATSGGGSTSAGSRNMGRIFTVQGGTGTGRQATSAASHAHRARVHLRPRRPSPATAAQHMGPAASPASTSLIMLVTALLPLLKKPHPVHSALLSVSGAKDLTLGEVSIDKTDPSTVEALVGQTVVLPCRVSPTPSSTVSVQWRRDGVPLSTHRHHQQPNGSLLVGPLTKTDSGWFLCVATREQERDHRYIYLSVSVLSGQAHLCWKCERDKLPDCPAPSSLPQRFSLSTFSGLKMDTPSVTPDSGMYTCTASTQQQLEQRQLQLRVQADLKITTAPNNIQVSEGSTALLPCVVSGDNVNIGWSRNGIPVRPDGRTILMSSDGSLILNDVKPSDEGTYTCNAYTGIYSVSATAEVRVSKDTQQ
ncbi:hypothetical protein FQN60_007163, partial [Etheostoma spectabile]